jgi:hypothetical protein
MLIPIGFSKKACESCMRELTSTAAAGLLHLRPTKEMATWVANPELVAPASHYAQKAGASRKGKNPIWA